MAKAVRQMRGPGMNKGLKKPRHGKFYTGETSSSSKKTSRSGEKPSTKDKKSPSYLGDSMQPRSNSGKSGAGSKQLFSKIFRSAS